MGKKIIKIAIASISLVVVVITIVCGFKQVIQDKNGNVYVSNKTRTEYSCKKENVTVSVEDLETAKKITLLRGSNKYVYELEPQSSSDITSVHIKTSGGEKTYTFDKTKHKITNLKNDKELTTIVRMGLGDTRALASEKTQEYILGLLFVILGGLGICFHRELAIIDNYIASMFYELKDIKKPSEVLVFLNFIAFLAIYGIGLFITVLNIIV